MERKSPAPATVITKQNAIINTSGNFIETASPERKQTKTNGINPIPKFTKLESEDDNVKI